MPARSWWSMCIIFGRSLCRWTLLLALFLSVPCLAQYEDLGSWNILNIKYTHNERFSGFFEAQLRSLSFYDQFHYHEYKAAVTYKAMSALRLTLGGGQYDTYRPGGDFLEPRLNSEQRIWPQASLDMPLGRVKIEQRYRAEFRFTSYGYRFRFRYRLGLSYAFGSERKGHKPWQLSASDEIFFTDNEPYFERNRAQVTLNYRLSRTLALQTGYLHQLDYRIFDEIGRDFLVMGVFLEFARDKIEAGDSDPDLRDN